MAESHRDEIAKLEALYASNPGGRVFVHLAEAYRKAGEHERARRILDEGLERHPDSASAYVVLGRVLADMQVTAEAEMAFRRVLDLDAGNLVALRWLGDLARQTGRQDEALSRYRELLARNPSNEEVRELVEVLGRTAPAAEQEPEAAPAWQELEAGLEETGEAVGWEYAADSGDESGGGEFEDYPVSPASVAPGQTEPAEEASYEYGFVDIEHSRQERVVGDEAEGAPEYPRETPSELVDESPELLDESPVYDEGELEELSGSSAAPTEVHLLDAALSPDETQDDADTLPDLDLSAFESVGEATPAWSETESSWEPEREADEFGAVEEPLTLLGEAEEPEGLGQAEPLGFQSEAETSDFALDAALDVVPDSGAPAAPASEAEEYWQDQEVPADTFAETTSDNWGDPGGVAAEEVEEVAAGADSFASAEPGEAAPLTETMAELYSSQGFHEHAAEVYRGLLRQRPGDEHLQAKLREAEQAWRQEPDDAAGEVWLRGTGAAWTGSGETEPAAEPTPYAWTQQPDDVQAGEPIRAYLRSLIAWRPGNGGQDAAAAAPEVPREWSLREPSGAAPEVAVASAAGEQTVTSEPPAWEEALLPDAMAGAAGDEDFTAWVSGLGGAEPGAGGQSGGAEPEEFWLTGPAGSGPAGGEGDWGETAPAGAEPWADDPGGGSGGAAAAAEQNAPPASEEEDREDEDLEMFRSWLQSLKK